MRININQQLSLFINTLAIMKLSHFASILWLGIFPVINCYQVDLIEGGKSIAFFLIITYLQVLASY